MIRLDLVVQDPLQFELLTAMILRGIPRGRATYMRNRLCTVLTVKIAITIISETSKANICQQKELYK